MTESAKNNEIPKQEPTTPPNTPEKSLAKERLNLHVKRRLQQDTTDTDAQKQPSLGLVESNNIVNNSSIQRNKLIEIERKASEKQLKTRKSYQKRTDRAVSDGSAVVRKYKRNKNKQQAIGTSVGNKVDGNSSVVVTAGSLNVLPSSSVSFNGNGDDGDGSHDGHEVETKYAGVSREKEKCADVLGLVLSAKKNALMQHPEVQAFLKKVMEAIKS